MEIGAIHPDTRLLGVELIVRDLDREISFYRTNLGLDLLEKSDGVARLGARETPFLTLDEQRAAPNRGRTTGMYHFAILVPSKVALARAVDNAVKTETEFQGFADHLVSEAAYLYDAEGNEIEIYRDRPRSEWQDAAGNLRMGTDPLDVEALLEEAHRDPLPEYRIEPGTTLGHMHLNVARIDTSLVFYQKGIGFGLMIQLGRAAAFVSAGGYHHHVGFNTWRGENLPPAPEGAAGLKHYTIGVPDEAELSALATRLDAAGYIFRREDGVVSTKDPSGIALEVRIDEARPQA